MIFEDSTQDRLLLPKAVEGKCEPIHVPLKNALTAITLTLVHDLHLEEWDKRKEHLAVRVRDDENTATWLYVPKHGWVANSFEPNDHVDVILLPKSVTFSDGRIARKAKLLWPTINYVGRVDVTKGTYEPDEIKAVKFKMGERHERLMVAPLTAVGHEIIGKPHTGRVTIYKDPADKPPRNAESDLRCSKCDLRFEVKRVKPIQVRVSHSQDRPWKNDNTRERDIHIFHDGKDWILVRNKAIEDAWNTGHVERGEKDTYWVISKNNVPALTADQIECEAITASPNSS